MTKVEIKEILAPPRHLRIGVAARVGSGKSTLIEGLGLAWGKEAILIDEDFKNNPHLSKAYDDPRKFVLDSQNWAFDRKVGQLKAVNNHFAVFVPLLVDKAYAKTYYKMGDISEKDWKEYVKNYNETIASGKVPQPDVILNLLIWDPALLRRIKERGRVFEQGITLEFLKTLGESLNECILESGIPVIPIDAEYQDFRDSKKMVDIIEGIEYEINQEFKDKFKDPSSGLLLPPFLGGRKGMWL